jgi:hypothetical protein
MRGASGDGGGEDEDEGGVLGFHGRSPGPEGPKRNLQMV